MALGARSGAEHSSLSQALARATGRAMKKEAQEIMRYLHRLIGKDELRRFQELFGGTRFTVPTINSVADTARDLEILAAWREKPAGNLQEFYRRQAREHGCSTRTVERALARVLKKAS